jgi:hypothetical protein
MYPSKKTMFSRRREADVEGTGENDIRVRYPKERPSGDRQNLAITQVIKFL